MAKDRRQESYRIREEAAELARSRVHPIHRANGDEQRYADEHYPMSFTKGLEHDEETGLVKNPAHFEAFRKAINEGFIDAFTENVTVPPVGKRRQWEAPTAGFVFDLEGPDAQAVTMPPAPELGSEELTFEMAEVYELALVRDVPFAVFTDNSIDDDDLDDSEKQKLNDAKQKLIPYINRLNALYGKHKSDLSRPRIDDEGEITLQTAFRGSSPGVEVGPYLSQFLLIGTQSDRFAGSGGDGELIPSDGKIVYGVQRIDQKVAKAAEVDFMTIWDEWLSVQNGEDTSADQKFITTPHDKDTSEDQKCIKDGARFIATPRDLTTYVHFDALYQAYLNACLILLGMQAPFDPDFGALSGSSNYEHFGRSIPRNANGFALFGGPHILTLVTEVATRALKAVRYQKFNNHLRLRPEALAARLQAQEQISDNHPRAGELLKNMLSELNAKNMLSELNATTEDIKKKNEPGILSLTEDIKEKNRLGILSFENLYETELSNIEKAVKGVVDSAIDEGHYCNDTICSQIIKNIQEPIESIIGIINENIGEYLPDPGDILEVIGDLIKGFIGVNININIGNCCKDKKANEQKANGIYEVIRKAIRQFIRKELSPHIGEIDQDKKDKLPSSILLPMAFPEGSPMHPAYGAGHAVVAGACVTILKAFFDTSAVFVNDKKANGVFKRREPGDTPIAYAPAPNGDRLIPAYDGGRIISNLQQADNPQEAEPLTLEGELNKLAANISIGRNMAGVHFFSDYYDSLRMGEEIAIGLLEEQALTYPKDDFVFSVPTFDGPVRRIGVK